MSNNNNNNFIVRMIFMFTRHLKEKNLTYSQHFIRAFKLSVRSGMASLLFFIHGIFPFIFETSGSRIISSLSKEMGKEMNKDEFNSQ